MATITTYPHVVKEDDKPARLERHPRLRVSMIVTHYLAYGRSPEEICLHLPHVSAAEVCSAMAYYFDHREGATEFADDLLLQRATQVA